MENEIKLLEQKLGKLRSQNGFLEEEIKIARKISKIGAMINDENLRFLNLIPIPVFLVRLFGNGSMKTIFVNEAFIKFTGLKREEVINKSPRKLFSKKNNFHIPIYSEDAKKQLFRDKVLNTDAVLDFDKNKIKYVELMPFLFSSGNENVILISLYDITNEIKYLRNIEEREDRYRNFINNSDNLIFRIAFNKRISTKISKKKQAELIFEHGYIAECNQAFADNMGMGDIDSVIGRKVSFFFGSISNKVTKDLTTQFISNGYNTKNKIVRQISRFGEEVFYSYNLFGDVKDNSLVQIWGVYHDVTELERVKRKLEKSRNEFQQLFEFSPVPMALVDEDLSVIAFNNQMVKTYGYTINDLPDLNSWYEKALRHLGDYEQLSKTWGKLALRVRKGKYDFISKETSILTKRGEKKHIIVSFSYIGNKYLISVNDVTEAKRAREEAELVKKIIENSPNILLQWEIKGNRFKLVYITKNISFLGYSSEKFIEGNKRFRDLMRRRDSVKLFRERREAYQEGKRNLRQRYQLITKEGEWRCFESYVSIVEEDNKVKVWEIVSDITEKKRAERKLIETVEKFKSIFDNSPIGIFNYNKDGIIENFNDIFVEILSSSREKLIGFNLFKQLQNKGVLAAVKKSFKGEQGIFEGLYKSVTSGKELYMRLIAQPLYDAEGKIAGGVGLLEDISERVASRLELEKTRDEFRKTANQLNFILNHIKDIVYEQRVDHTIIFISGSIKNVLGYTPTEFMLKRKQLFTDNPINKPIDKKLDEVLKFGKHARYHIEIWTKNGKKVLLEVSESPIKNKGKITGLIGVARDVTESYRSQQIQEAVHAIGAMTYKAKTLSELYKFIHETISKFMPADNFFIALIDPANHEISFQYYVDEVDSEMPEPHELRNGFTEYAIRKKLNTVYKKKDIEELLNKKEFELIGTIPEAIAVSYLKFSDGREGTIVLQDYYNPDAYAKEDVQFLRFVSTQIIQSIEKKQAEDKLIKTNRELKKAERELRRQAAELKKSNANKDKLFSIIAHDLRSPFTALLGLTNMLDEMLDDMDKDEIREMVTALNNSATNLYKLLENLLNWSRLQLGRFHLNKAKFPVYDAVLSVSNALASPLEQKNIKLVNRVSKDILVYADFPTIEMAIRNLVNNAVKFTPEGGKITVSSSVESSPGFVEISVSDTGIGMPPEILNNLFRVDKKVSRKGTRNEAGTGLGLVLVKELVEKNGGTIRVTSEENKGSTFTFTVPLAKD